MMGMRSLRSFLAASLCAGLAVAAAPASAGGPLDPRIDDEVYVDEGDNQAELVLTGTDFSAGGLVFGLGTGGDDVIITFFTPLPSNASASDRKGAVRQKNYSELAIDIVSAEPLRDLVFIATPEKCDVNGKVNLEAGNGTVTAKCSGDDLLAPLSPAQLESVLTAFEGSNRVKVKVNPNGKASIDITIKGEAEED